MERLSKVLQEYQATHHETAEQLDATVAKLRKAKNEQAFWEQMAAEAEQAKVALERRLAEQQTVAGWRGNYDVQNFEPPESVRLTVWQVTIKH